MSSITKSSMALGLALLGFAGVLSVAGCGDKNQLANYSANTGEHPANWLSTTHPAFARNDLANCTQCHGQDLGGGISKVACAECHVVTLLAPNTISAGAAIHPGDWDNLVYARHAPYVRANGDANCASATCHGTTLAGGFGPSCTACHIGGILQVHPWTPTTDFTPLSATPPSLPLHGQYVLGIGTTAPYNVAHGTASCSNAVCHGTQLQGVPLSGPACASCHPNGF